MYPRLDCYTCEMDTKLYNAAKINLHTHPNIEMSHQMSTDFLRYTIEPADCAMFWLDAHSHGWGCELDKELAIVLRRWKGGYIFMDDFQVPDKHDFGYDWYDSFGPLNWENVSKDLPVKAKNKIKQMFYPHYPYIFGTRGWCLLVFGDADLLHVDPVGILTEVELVKAKRTVKTPKKDGTVRKATDPEILAKRGLA